MKTYKIEVHSIGYLDHCLLVQAENERKARQHEREAKIQWCDLNAIDMAYDFEMPFTRITRAD